MSGNENREQSTLSGTASPRPLSFGQCMDAGASDQEEHGNDSSGNIDATVTSPPLGVKLTGYRLFNMTTMFSFCIIKSILTYKGQSAAPTTLDWVSGAVLAVVLYWIGLYEGLNSKKWDWFFQVDLVPGICCCTKRVVAGGEIEPPPSLQSSGALVESAPLGGRSLYTGYGATSVTLPATSYSHPSSHSPLLRQGACLDPHYLADGQYNADLALSPCKLWNP